MSEAESGWKALVHVRPLGGNHCLERDSGGAYVCVLALARTESHFREVVNAEMDEQGLIAIEMQEVETFDPATVDWNNDELQELTGELSDQAPVRYRTFYNYPRDDLDA